MIGKRVTLQQLGGLVDLQLAQMPEGDMAIIVNRPIKIVEDGEIRLKIRGEYIVENQMDEELLAEVKKQFQIAIDNTTNIITR